MRILSFLLSLFLLAGCGAVPETNTQTTNTSYTQISEDEALNFMKENTGYIILDVRTEEEFLQKHIKGAINIPNETIGTEEISALPDKNQTILVYCRSANPSKQASEKLVKLGYTNVIEFGGINNWHGEIVEG